MYVVVTTANFFIGTHMQPQGCLEAFPNHVRNIGRSTLRNVLAYANDVWTRES
jgi:hypothetical protein